MGKILVLIIGIVMMPIATANSMDEAVALLKAMNTKQKIEVAIDQFSQQMDIDLRLAEDTSERLFNEKARIYAEVYTQEELRGIRLFYESSAGKAFLAKESQLSQKYLEFIRELMAETYDR